MDIAGKGLQPHVDPLVKEIKRLDLTENVMELEAYGFTVIPPSKTGISPEWIGRLRDAIIGTVERRGDMDLSGWETRTTDVPYMAKNWELLREDDVFVEAALQPAGLAMARWLCGQTVSMAGHTLIAKGPTPAERSKNLDPGAAQRHAWGSGWRRHLPRLQRLDPGNRLCRRRRWPDDPGSWQPPRRPGAVAGRYEESGCSTRG